MRVGLHTETPVSSPVLQPGPYALWWNGEAERDDEGTRSDQDQHSKDCTEESFMRKELNCSMRSRLPLTS